MAIEAMDATTAPRLARSLSLTHAVPLAGLPDMTSRFTLVIFAVVNIALIRTKSRAAAPPAGAFVCPRWVPFAGLVSNIAFLAVDLFI